MIKDVKTKDDFILMLEVRKETIEEMINVSPTSRENIERRYRVKEIDFLLSKLRMLKETFEELTKQTEG